jgi:uncharacterized protein (TIGR04222 family)
MEPFSTVASLRGPEFLALYSLVSAGAVTASALLARRADPAPGMAAAQLPGAATDPYEVAWLRGGPEAVLTTALFSMRQRGMLAFGTLRAPLSPPQMFTPVAGGPAPRNRVESAVLSAVSQGAPARTLLADKSLRAAVDNACEPYRDKYLHAGLITSPAEQRRALTVMAAGLAIVLGLGGFKLVAAISTGHYNVGFLILIGLAASAFLVWLCRPRRLNARGRAYLKSVLSAYAGWRFRQRVTPGDAGSMLPLYVAMFGPAVLVGTEFGDLHRALERPRDGAGADGGGGGGCGSGDGGGGDGGGSSCGGGGCGGCGGGGCGG